LLDVKALYGDKDLKRRLRPGKKRNAFQAQTYMKFIRGGANARLVRVRVQMAVARMDPQEGGAKI